MSNLLTKPSTIVIAAGGTGGHFFPAEALADILYHRGHTLVLMTDIRTGIRKTGVFSSCKQYVLPGSGVVGRSPLRAASAGLTLLHSAWKARQIFTTLSPDIVIGFGGYSSVPPIIGARLLNRQRPILILHEGNAVLGRANALLSRFADVIATSFPTVARLPKDAQVMFTGMPIRPSIAALAHKPWIPLTNNSDRINLLVWGGSLGAHIFSYVVPQAIGQLPDFLRKRIHIFQQARQEDVESVRTAYSNLGVIAHIEPFFHHVTDLLKKAHLVIGRSGGSSVAEITAAGRPSILVPFPFAASDEQTANARVITQANAGWMIPQSDFTAVTLATQLENLFMNPEKITLAAQAAAKLARPHAAEHLANVLEEYLVFSSHRFTSL